MIINISSEYKKGNRPWHARGCLDIRGYEKTAIFRWFGNVLVEIHDLQLLKMFLLLATAGITSVKKDTH